MKKLSLLLLSICFFMVRATAQEYFREDFKDRPVNAALAYEGSKFNGGFGFGLDYGGTLGVKVSYLPTPWLGLFGSVGLYYYTTGYSVGLQLKLPSEKKISGYLTGMYGTNGGLESEVEITRKQYYGPSVGGGIEIKTRKENIFWSFNLLIPFRDAQLQKDVDELESQGLTVYSSTWPVNFCIGLHFKIATY